MTEPGQQPPSHPVWERVALFVSGIAGIIGIVALVTVIPTPSDAQWQIYWTVLALMVAAFGALLPGFIEVKHKNILRAGGAIGLFVVVLFGGNHIKMLGGATREDKLAQADSYIETYLASKADEIRRDKLDLLNKAAEIYEKANAAERLVVAQAYQCEAAYGLKLYQEAMERCELAIKGLQSASLKDKPAGEKFKLLAYSTLYFHSAQSLLKATLDDRLGYVQAMDYADATRDWIFAVSFDADLAHTLIDNNSNTNPTGEIGFARALATLVGARPTSRAQAEFALDRYSGLVASYLVRVVDSYDDTHARPHCDFLATNIQASELNLRTLVRTWKLASAPLKKVGADWNSSRCISVFRFPRSSYLDWNE